MDPDQFSHSSYSSLPANKPAYSSPLACTPTIGPCSATPLFGTFYDVALKLSKSLLVCLVDSLTPKIPPRPAPSSFYCEHSLIPCLLSVCIHAPSLHHPFTSFPFLFFSPNIFFLSFFSSFSLPPLRVSCTLLGPDRNPRHSCHTTLFSHIIRAWAWITFMWLLCFTTIWSGRWQACSWTRDKCSAWPERLVWETADVFQNRPLFSLFSLDNF